MKKLALFVTVMSLALPAAAAEGEAKGTTQDPMAGWVPRKVTREKEGRKEIDALLRRWEEAGKKGDLDGVVQFLDFPVLMVTDDAKGQAMAGSWDREKWIEMMKPFYAEPHPDMKTTHKTNVYFITDSLATVGDDWTTTVGGKGAKKSMSARSSLILVRVGGAWKVKSMMEGGWGDMMGHEAHAQEQGGASGTGAAGTEAGASGGTQAGASGGASGGTSTGTSGGTDTGTTK